MAAQFVIVKRKHTWIMTWLYVATFGSLIGYSPPVLGFTAAFAAYGSFFIPKLFGWSVETTGTHAAAFYIFIAFYVVSFVLNWYFYQRKRK